jgi:hypothetical protein
VPNEPGLADTGPRTDPGCRDATRLAKIEPALAEHIRTARPHAGRPKLRAGQVQWIEADLGGGISGVLITTARRSPRPDPAWSSIVATDGSDTLVTVPTREGGDGSGPLGFSDEAHYLPAALVDLDVDGHPELLVEEHWYEGMYTWLVRWDAARGALVADLVGGSAA